MNSGQRIKRFLRKSFEKHPNWLKIQSIIEKIKEHGFEVFIVGGAVREALLNRQVKDIDLSSSAKPDDLLKIFPQAKDIFKKYGVIFIPLKNQFTDQNLLEIVSFRTDSLKSDGRRPVYIRYGNLQEDFRRRDFTINALYYDFQKEEIIDFTEGLKHLKEKRLKTIGSAEDRFKEDYLRILRALRFENQLGFQLDPEVLSAIQKLKHKITSLSLERRTDEIHKVFSSGRVLSFIFSLEKRGLFDLIFPSLDFTQTKSCLKDKEGKTQNLSFYWATILSASLGKDKKAIKEWLEKNFVLTKKLKKEILNLI